MSRYRYPTAPIPAGQTMYAHVCTDCGATRHYGARPGSLYAPKICKDCHARKQDRLLSQIMKQPHMPREYPHLKGA
jgi:hypothetical protein